MIKLIIDKLIHDSKYDKYFDTNKKLSYVMISTGGYRPYEKSRIVFLILQDDLPSLVVKFYKQPNGLIQNEFKTQEIIYKKCEGKGISKPLGLLIVNDFEIMVEEGIKGKNLDRYISDNPFQNSIELVMYQINSLYNHLNNLLEPSTFDAFNKEVNQFLDKFMRLYSLTDNELLTVKECVSVYLQNFKNKKLFKRYSNGDFQSRNFILDDENVTLIDFEDAHETHFYHFDWFRFFKYQYSLSNDYFYSVLIDMDINDPLIISSLAEFTKSRSNKQFDIASRMIFEIKEYVQRSDSLSLGLLHDEKKNMKQFISDVSLRLNDKQVIDTHTFSLNDRLSSKKNFYHHLYSKIHEYAEFDLKTQNISKEAGKLENKIKKLVSENTSLQRTNSALSTFIDDDVLDSPLKKTVDELYLEILHRRVDREGLMHFSHLLEKKEITIDDLRKSLLDSDEYQMLD